MQTRSLPAFILILTASFSLTGCNIDSLVRGDFIQDLNSQFTLLSPGNPEQQTAIKEQMDIEIESSTPGNSEEKAENGTDKAVEDKKEETTPHPIIEQQPLPSQDEGIWQRVRKGFKLEVPDNELMTQHISRLKQHKTYIDRIQRRAEPYIHFILNEAEKRNLPTELALLPAVESSYQPFAYSHGRAAGLWQFVPATGRHFKLKQNWWYDGRRDVVASTHAAFDYLESLARRFDGDWELALAAYNCGAGNVNKAIRENKRKGKPTDFWSLKLPKETSGYVPRLLALSRVIQNPDESGIKLRPIPNEPYFVSVDIGSQLDLALAAEMAGISTDDLYRLNPGLNRWATPPDGPHMLNLPVVKAGEFKQKLAELEPNQRIHWKRHKISSGDTVSTIAHKYDTTSKLIRQANNLKGNNIRAGKYLVIPTATKSLEHYALTADKRKKRIQNRKRKGNKLIHVVEAGDSFWDLAIEYKVSHRKLAKWNGMAPRDTLKLGQKLVVWVDDKIFKKHNSTKLPSIMDVRPPSTRNSVYYRVREGDSLSTIAHRFKVKVADLKKWNSLTGKYLKPGQNLKLYVDVTAQAL